MLSTCIRIWSVGSIRWFSDSADRTSNFFYDGPKALCECYSNRLAVVGVFFL